MKDYKSLLQILAGIFLFLVVYSYSSLDPSLNSIAYGTNYIHNYFGVFGAYIADILIQFFGKASYTIGVLLVFMPFLKQRPYIKTFSFLLLVSNSVLVALLNKQGGITGNITAKLLTEHLGILLSVLFFAILSIGLSFYVLGIKLSELFQQLRSNYKLLIKLVLGIHVYDLFKFLSGAFNSIKPIFLDLFRSAILIFKAPELFFKSLVAFVMVSPLLLLFLVLVPLFVIFAYLFNRKKQSSLKAESNKQSVIIKRVRTKNKVSNTRIIQGVRTQTRYQLPRVSLLSPVPRQRSAKSLTEIKIVQDILENKLRDFNVQGKIVSYTAGPVITQYEFKPASGVKISKIANLSDDLALALGTGTLRIVAPIPGKSVVGIEVPKQEREFVYARDMLASSVFQSSSAKIPIVIGKTTEGKPYVFDLTKAPHLLVAGATGSGKSVFINTLISSILFKFKPELVKLVLVDPKMIELSVYADIPHLMLPVITDVRLASNALKWLVSEMEDRYKKLSELGVRGIESYNKKAKDKMSYIVVIIDELADLMMVSPKEVETYIARLAQMARAAGIHLVLATQRPSVNVITGLIKANFPARISFKVPSKIDSRTILDVMGAEKLLGMGDMLFLQPSLGKMLRLHGAFISDDDVKTVVDFLKLQAKPQYIDVKLDSIGDNEDDEYEDELYQEAVDLIRRTRRASISFIQQKFRIGYNRAARIIDAMETRGVVSAPDKSGRREVI